MDNHYCVGIFKWFVATLLLWCSTLSYALVSGTEENGALINDGQVNEYTFSAQAGDTIALSVSGDIILEAELYAPDGSSIGQTSSVIQIESSSTGEYTLQVRAYYAGQTGNYTVNYNRMPGQTELAPLTGTSAFSSALTAGDLDSVSFEVQANETIYLSVTGDLTLHAQIFDPTGARVGITSGSIELNNLTLGGRYTVLIRSYYAHQTGDYEVNFFQTASATEFPRVVSGQNATTDLTSGDLDSGLFFANVGESVVLSVSGDITLLLEVYSPSGENIAQGSGVIELDNLPETGNYQILVRSYYAFQSGTYTLHFFRAPAGTEYGTISSASDFTGTLTAGDLDSAEFDIEAGDGITFSVSGDITVQLAVYDPLGNRIGQSSGVLELNALAETGTYTVVVRSYYSFQQGTYDIHFVRQSRGPLEYGQLNSGEMLSESLSAGDLDSFQLHAELGNSIYLSATGDVLPLIEIYTPTGYNIAQSSSMIELNDLPETGDYTVIIRSYYGHQTGNYDLHFVKAPGSTELGALTSGNTQMDSLTAGDLDSFSFDANTGDDVTVSINSDILALIDIYSPSGANIAQGATSISLNALSDSGTYTVVVRSYYSGQTGDYSITYTNQ